jgi:calcium binding protein 39
MKVILYGDGGELRLLLRLDWGQLLIVCVALIETEPQPEQVAQLAQETYNNDALQLMVQNIWRFEFEVSNESRDTRDGHLMALLYSSLITGKEGCLSDLQQSPSKANRDKVAHSRVSDEQARGVIRCFERVRAWEEDYDTACLSNIRSCIPRYENPDVALNTGMILREMLRHEVLAKTLLYSDRFYTFPDHIEKTTFGVSCDAFANLKETLTRHKGMVAEYLEKNYDRVRVHRLMAWRAM